MQATRSRRPPNLQKRKPSNIKEQAMNPVPLFSRESSEGRPGEITYEPLTAALGSGSCVLVDVREPLEFAAGHVPGAVNRPLSTFDPAELPTDKPVVLMCQAGGRSAKALAKTVAVGRTDVVHYPGSMTGWRSEGGPST
jgi:rhodanese-related sulfurtransferase